MKDVPFDRDMKDILSKLHLGDLFIVYVIDINHGHLICPNSSRKTVPPCYACNVLTSMSVFRDPGTAPSMAIISISGLTSTILRFLTVVC